MDVTSGVRARARAELTEQIKGEARRQLAEVGPSGLSLRAVAREVGMVSSAVYRYFPSREQLLTALIIDAYDEIGAAAEAADGACRRDDLGGRWRAVCTAVRTWAHANPRQYALVYGSPVPGYRAPDETVGPASRVTLTLAAVASDAAAAGLLGNPFAPERSPALAKRARAEAKRVGPGALPGVSPHGVIRALVAWTQLFGLISFELFGHLDGVVDDRDALFAQSVTDMGAFIGLPPGG